MRLIPRIGFLSFFFLQWPYCLVLQWPALLPDELYVFYYDLISFLQ